MPRLSDLTTLGRVVVGAVVLILVVALVWWGIWMLGAGDRKRANEAQASQAVAEVRAGAGGDAVNTVATNAASEAATDRQTTENRDAILNAPGADAPVDSRAGDAGRRAQCMRRSTQRDPVCQRLLGTRP